LSSTPDALEARITELEIKLSFAEDTVESLNASVFRQQQQIDLLVQEIRVLRQQLHSSLPNEPRSLRDELPPHY
jgi:SlyX protein